MVETDMKDADAILRELVELKRLKDRIDAAGSWERDESRAHMDRVDEYERRKPAAWAAAFEWVDAQKAAPPAAQPMPFNHAADCSPLLTQCPRCNNPWNACDMGKATPPVAQPAMPEPHSGLVNEAAWKFIEAMPYSLPAPIFNNLKPALYAALRYFHEQTHAQKAAPPAAQPDEFQLRLDVFIDALKTAARMPNAATERNVADAEKALRAAAQVEPAPADPERDLATRLNSVRAAPAPAQPDVFSADYRRGFADGVRAPHTEAEPAPAQPAFVRCPNFCTDGMDGEPDGYGGYIGGTCRVCEGAGWVKDAAAAQEQTPSAPSAQEPKGGAS